MPMYGFPITPAGRVCRRRPTKYSCECRCASLLSRDHAVAAGLVSALLNIAANADDGFAITQLGPGYLRSLFVAARRHLHDEYRI
jgi:hypothetical protein